MTRSHEGLESSSDSKSKNKLRACSGDYHTHFVGNEASCKLSLLKVVTRDRVCHPEKVLPMFAIGPSWNLSLYVDLGVGEAGATIRIKAHS